MRTKILPEPMGLGQYDSLGEYCGPHTASSVFLISLSPISSNILQSCGQCLYTIWGHLIELLNQ